MCGRYSNREHDTIREKYRLRGPVPETPPRYNIAPTQDVSIIHADGAGLAASMARWGLIPGWARDARIGARLINARAETVAEKPAFRSAFRARRCLIPADGFYEWAGPRGAKQPWYVTSRDGAPFVFAGLWERWRDHAGAGMVESCTIITTEANGVIAPIHHRMPVVLDVAGGHAWLEDGEQDLLRPCPDDRLRAWPVSRLVNGVHNDVPECSVPLAGLAAGRSAQSRMPY